MPDKVDDLVTANRILAREKVLDGYGHVSVRDVDDPRPEDTFDNLRAFAQSLTDHPVSNNLTHAIAAPILSIMDGE